MLFWSPSSNLLMPEVYQPFSGLAPILGPPIPHSFICPRSWAHPPLDQHHWGHLVNLAELQSYSLVDWSTTKVRACQPSRLGPILLTITVTISHLNLCDSMNCNMPGSWLHNNRMAHTAHIERMPRGYGPGDQRGVHCWTPQYVSYIRLPRQDWEV